MSFAPWIKIEQTLPDKPEVVRMAAALDVDQDSVTGKLLRVWIWVDANFISGETLPITATFIDRITSCPGFATAMRAVGWLAGEDGSLVIPGFERHNGETAKERAKIARRVDKHRRRTDLAVTSGSSTSAAPIAESHVADTVTKSVTETVTSPSLFSLQTPLPRERDRDRKDISPLPPHGGASEGAPPEDPITRPAPQVQAQKHHPGPAGAALVHRMAPQPVMRSFSTAPAAHEVDDQILIDHIKSLRRRWQASPLLSAREARVFRKNRAIVTLFTPDDWHTLARFMSTRLPEGTAYFQPEMMEKFLDNPGAILGHAREWQAKQRPKPPAIPSLVPHHHGEAAVTPEEMRAILRMNS
ncbi:MAG: hypothetical protein EOP88_10375 [Verrucomicrobiaceae bacterium]|nr:MAG: hypothetical protein EOP88_10375 [Verrucomicrobiaceae bacterium]